MNAQVRVKLLLAAAAVLVSASAALGQTASVWDGVYNDAQAERGGAKQAVAHLIGLARPQPIYYPVEPVLIRFFSQSEKRKGKGISPFLIA